MWTPDYKAMAERLGWQIVDNRGSFAVALGHEYEGTVAAGVLAILDGDIHTIHSKDIDITGGYGAVYRQLQEWMEDLQDLTAEGACLLAEAIYGQYLDKDYDPVFDTARALAAVA